ncbi:trypsin epsilon-like [Aricia agestis]|uniref:trypsin epsilon-like n=1 Tax=Aricia agestis TaxID=91739 RepID=UPI001C201B83|nr:trypsin epsilon-like [Aricia agestis]
MQCRSFVVILLGLVLCVHFSVCILKKNVAKSNPSVSRLYPIEKRVIGGIPTSLNQYPFTVQFINLGALCGGSILSKKTVLTAAHCFDLNQDKEEMIIVANARFVMDYRGIKYEVWDYIVHEGYLADDKESYSNDVAVILIQEDFEFNDSVQTAQLCTTSVWMRRNETFYATGWGETEYGKSVLGNALSSASLSFVDTRDCTEWNKLAVSADQFCLYGDGERDTCRGDSGGPILWRGLIVGITSYGRRCGTAPGMYVNVGYFHRWIQNAVTSLKQKFCLFEDES